MITESFHKYKDWDFRIRCVTNNGASSRIFKDVPTANPNSLTGIKRLFVREKAYSFIDINELINKTKDFIDNNEDILIKSLASQKLKNNII